MDRREFFAATGALLAPRLTEAGSPSLGGCGTLSIDGKPVARITSWAVGSNNSRLVRIYDYRTLHDPELTRRNARLITDRARRLK